MNQSARVTTPFAESKAADPYVGMFFQSYSLSNAVLFNYRPEKQIKLLEATLHEIVEESIIAQNKEEFRLALDKAKEAINKERTLLRQKEQSGLVETNNDLAFMV